MSTKSFINLNSPYWIMSKPEYEPSKLDPEIPAPRQPNPNLPEPGDPPNQPAPMRDPPPSGPEPTPSKQPEPEMHETCYSRSRGSPVIVLNR